MNARNKFGLVYTSELYYLDENENDVSIDYTWSPTDKIIETVFKNYAHDVIDASEHLLNDILKCKYFDYDAFMNDLTTNHYAQFLMFTMYYDGFLEELTHVYMDEEGDGDEKLIMYRNKYKSVSLLEPTIEGYNYR